MQTVAAAAVGFCFLTQQHFALVALRDTSEIPGVSSVCGKQASHNCWCSLFLLIAEMGSGLGQSQCCLLPGVTWEGSAAKQMSAAVTENCQDSEYC